jgi:hypothetical protein
MQGRLFLSDYGMEKPSLSKAFVLKPKHEH